MSGAMWGIYQPDRFDIYSVGIIFMQLSIPELRSIKALQDFNKQIKACGHDLWLWRARECSDMDTAVLDADDEAGWKLASSLLCPHARRQDLRAGLETAFNGGNALDSRPSAKEALKDKFFKLRIYRNEKSWSKDMINGAEKAMRVMAHAKHSFSRLNSAVELQTQTLKQLEDIGAPHHVIDDAKQYLEDLKNGLSSAVHSLQNSVISKPEIAESGLKIEPQAIESAPTDVNMQTSDEKVKEGSASSPQYESTEEIAVDETLQTDDSSEMAFVQLPFELSEDSVVITGAISADDEIKETHDEDDARDSIDDDCVEEDDFVHEEIIYASDGSAASRRRDYDDGSSLFIFDLDSDVN